MKIIKNYKSFLNINESIENNDIFYIETIVSVLDCVKLNKDLDENVKKSTNEIGNENISYHLRVPKLAFCRNKLNEFFLFDDELVGRTFLKNKEVDVDIYKDTIKENGQKTIGVMPIGTIGLSLSDLTEYIIGEISIKEFMGNRFNYNSRIERNMYIFKQWYLTGK